ncbi:MAG: hypothetical protein Ct9H300mP1_33020 [Planctomycetaceae bacterium]|nr:MAG: hypothetical protein Ct9H300mP1_33020 [Planctomycetaceae bacterium]
MGRPGAVASLFMGVQLQCARCHDDPYRDWSQREHWGLAAFFGRSQGDFNKIEVGKGASKKPGESRSPVRRSRIRARPSRRRSYGVPSTR